jgi:hypothetical protein
MSDDFDFDGTRTRSRSSPMPLWDILSIVVLVLTACIVGYFVMIFLNPGYFATRWTWTAYSDGNDYPDSAPTHVDSQRHVAAHS